MSTPQEITENLTAQVNELQALESVYPTELVVADHGVLADINEYIERPDKDPPRWLEYAIAISLNGVIYRQYYMLYPALISWILQYHIAYRSFLILSTGTHS